MSDPTPPGGSGGEQRGWSLPASASAAPAGARTAAPATASNGVALAAVIAGAGAIALGFIPFVAIPVGLVAVLLGIAGLLRAKVAGAGKPLAVAGTVSGAIGIAIGLAWVAFSIGAPDEAIAEHERVEDLSGSPSNPDGSTGDPQPADDSDPATPGELSATAGAPPPATPDDSSLNAADQPPDGALDQPDSTAPDQADSTVPEQPAAAPHRAASFPLAVGQCFDGEDLAELASPVASVPCEQPHDNEVVELLSHPAAATAPYPGRSQLDAWALNECMAPFEYYVGIPYIDSTFLLSGVIPSQQSWSDGDREVVCVLHRFEAITGSARGVAR